MLSSLDALLAELETARNQFGLGAAGKVKTLLDQISRHEFRDARLLIRLHESLLFLRAFPQSAALVPKIENLLDTFYKRVESVRAAGADMTVFDDFDTSGIAGTTMQDTLNFEVARWLVTRIPRNVEIAWDEYEEERAWGMTWPRFVPLLEEDSDVEANIPWRRWLDAARGREQDLPWLIRQFERVQLAGVGSERAGAELYDSLRIPIRWKLENLKLSRTRNWQRPRQIYIHEGPLISRRQVSLSQELARPGPRLTRLSRRESEAVMHWIREVMVIRYRELYGTTLGDPRSVRRAELGRGVVMYFWNLPVGRRLPLRAYVAGFTVKNGVPVNYIEAIGLCEWIEVGFNTFYTFRQGETAWIYAQALRCLCALTGARVISVYPYQIGQDNDEALDSGAFWFYRKLGFRSGKPQLEAMARREELKIAADPKYRTPRRILKRLAEAHVFYELPRDSQAPKREKEGAWDTFATRNLALRVNRRMAREFYGDAARIREASAREASRALHLNASRWAEAARRSLENWSLILALIPNLGTWSAEEKRELVRLIRSQSASDEMQYLWRTQHHERLRGELLRLGSKSEPSHRNGEQDLRSTSSE
jgi:hypothetical protein